MKKSFKLCMLMIACLMTSNLFATYYIAGNGHEIANSVWCSGYNWSADGTPLINDDTTFTNLPAGWYEFKITEGSWNPTYGYSEVDAAASTPMYKTYGTGNNICFRLQAASNVTVKMVNNKVVLLIDREFIITGNGNEAGGSAWLGSGHQWKDEDDDNKLDADFSHTYYNLPAATYKFRIKENLKDAWNGDCTWGYDHLDTENSISCSSEGDAKNICFTLTRPGDVTIALVNNQIRVNANAVYFITGNGAAARGAWCNQKDWTVNDADSRLDPTTLAKTYTNLPAETYQFKISNGAWPTNGGTVWNHNNVDFETSSFGYYWLDNDNHNVAFTLTGAADVTIQFDPATGKISLTSSKGYFDATYHIVGDADLISTGWDEGETTCELISQGDGTFQYIQSGKVLAAKEYEYKLVANRKAHSGCLFPDGDAKNTLSIDKADTYTLTYTFNPTAKTLTCSAVSETATALENVNFKNDGKYYDVLGRQIANPQKGNLYIHNGKKVLY